MALTAGLGSGAGCYQSLVTVEERDEEVEGPCGEADGRFEDGGAA